MHMHRPLSGVGRDAAPPRAALFSLGASGALAAVLGVTLALAPGCAPQARRDPAPTPQAQAAADAELPAVLLGEAELTCNIDTKKNGLQKLVMHSGGGLEFDAVVSPIVDGIVHVKGPAEGGDYQFTSHLAQPAQGKLSGVGVVTIESMDTKVAVEVKRYQQPGGPGTPFTFTAADMQSRGIYVEFVGKARAQNGDRFAFRINLGAAQDGSGKVTPATPDYNTNMMAKSVIVRAPVATTVSSVTKLQRIPVSAP